MSGKKEKKTDKKITNNNDPRKVCFEPWTCSTFVENLSEHKNYPNLRLGLRFCDAIEFFNNLVNNYVFFFNRRVADGSPRLIY